MRSIVSVLLVLLTLSCNDVSARSAGYLRSRKNELQSRENFDRFFKRYNSDEAFQLSRTVFPLKMQVVDEDGVVTTKLLQKEKWKPMHLLSKNYIIKKKPHGKDQMIVSLQIEDTGVFVEHVFKLDRENRNLILITDSST